MLKSGNLPKLSIKKVDNNYNIYGNFISDNKIQSCNAHLKIDTIGKKISLAKCQCSTSVEFDSKNNIYLCEHLVALGLIFVQQIKKKINSTNLKKEAFRKDKKLLSNLPRATGFKLSREIELDQFNNSLNRNKEKLNINISLKEIFEEDKKYFELNMFVGNNTMYPIYNIEEFILSLYNSEEYYIGKGLIYNRDNYYFSKEDQGVLEYIYEHILFLKDSKGSTIRIHREVLRRFLKIISKKIKFNYSYQTYICEIMHEDLPISFTFKQVNGEYILTTKKVFPIPLNNKMDVFFYDRKIYTPSETQINLYKLFYNTLKEDGKIIFKGDISIEELYNLIFCINVISKDTIIDDSIIEKLANNIKVDFKFERKENNSYCKVTMKLNEIEFSYNEVLNSTNFNIKNSKRIRIIESELNKNRFFYKDGIFIFYGSC